MNGSSAELGKDTDLRDGLRSWFDSWSKDLGNRALAICLLVGGLLVAVEMLRVPIVFDFLEAQELLIEDKFFALRDGLGLEPKRLAQDIILVCVDSDSRRRLGIGDQLNCPRGLYALLLKKLENAGADVVGFDLPLAGSSIVQPAGSRDVKSTGPTELSLPAVGDDLAMIAEFQKAKNVVLSSTVLGESAQSEGLARTGIYRSPFGPFIDALGVDSGSVGNALIAIDGDDLVRRAPLIFAEFNPSAFFYKSFALRLAEKKYASRALMDSSDRIFLRRKVLPTGFRINFLGPPGTFKMIPLWRALEWEKHLAHHGLFLAAESSEQTREDEESFADGHSPDNPFKNRIVLVGLVDNQVKTTGVHGKDSQAQKYSSALAFQTPVSQMGAPMSALEIQANVLANVLHDLYISEPEIWKEIFVIVLIALMFGKLLGALNQRPWLSVGALIVFSTAWIGLSFGAFVIAHLFIPVVVPVFALAIPCCVLVLSDHLALERREKRRRTRVFRSLAAKPLAQEIERKLLAELGLEGKRMLVTVMACQLKDFASDLEQDAPEVIMERLNACLAVMMSSIADHSGVVERIWNCGLIGLWGAPIAMPQAMQAKLACDCALQIHKKLKGFREGAKSYQTGESAFQFSCGINSGEAICGTINASARDSTLTQYGAIGPAVDAAIELEALNSTYGTSFILGDFTATLVSATLEIRELDGVTLNGRQSVQAIHELLPWEGSLPGALEEAMALFKQGRDALNEGRLREAEQSFMTGLRMVPDDRPTVVMLDRCRELLSRQRDQAEPVREKMTLKDRLTSESSTCETRFEQAKVTGNADD